MMTKASPQHEPVRLGDALTLAYRKYHRARTDADRDAAFRLAERYALRMVGRFIASSCGPHWPAEDMRQAARLGLVRAFETWCEGRGRSLVGHVRFEMIAGIRKYQESYFQAVHIPVHIQRSRMKSNRAKFVAETLGLPNGSDTRATNDVADSSLPAAEPTPHIIVFHIDDLSHDVCHTASFESELCSKIFIDDLLSCLPRRQRLAIEWRYVYGADNEMISKATGMEMKTISNLLYIARNTLRARFIDLKQSGLVG